MSLLQSWPARKVRYTRFIRQPVENLLQMQKIYIDPYCKELALEPYRPHSTSKLFWSNLFSAIGLDVFVSVVVLFAANSESIAGITFGIGFPVCWGLMFLHSLRNRKKIEQNHLKMWTDSDNRLKNSQYAVLLANLDYKVPSQYLPPDFKYASETENYKPAKVSGFNVG